MLGAVNPLMQLAAGLPLPTIMNVVAKYNTMAGLRVDELRLSHVHELLALVKRPLPEGVLSELVKSAVDANPTQTVSTWFDSITGDGTVERLFNQAVTPKQPESLLTRCPHCGQPQEATVIPQLGSLTRCVHCGQPFVATN